MHTTCRRLRAASTAVAPNGLPWRYSASCATPKTSAKNIARPKRNSTPCSTKICSAKVQKVRQTTRSSSSSESRLTWQTTYSTMKKMICSWRKLCSIAPNLSTQRPPKIRIIRVPSSKNLTLRRRISASRGKLAPNQVARALRRTKQADSSYSHPFKMSLGTVAGRQRLLSSTHRHSLLSVRTLSQAPSVTQSKTALLHPMIPRQSKSR